MIQIVATAEQAKILAESNESVKIVDAQGKLLGFVDRSITEEDIQIAIARRNSDSPRRTTEEVLARLKQLASDQS